MTKIFKNSKSVISFVLVFAVLAVSLFTGAVITSEALCSDTITDTWAADTSLAKYSNTGTSPYKLNYNTYNLVDPELEGTGEEGDPYIISTAEELVAVSRGHVASEGKFFKVKDGIKAFYLNQYLTANGGSSAWIDENADFDTVVKTFTGEWTQSNGKALGNNVAQNQNPFKGTFDGNGVTIYGLISKDQNQLGLFPMVEGNVTIKNVSVKKSYVSAKASAAVLVGTSLSGSLTVENCSVVDAYVKSTYTARKYGIGAIYGSVPHAGAVTVKNCLIDVDSSQYFLLSAGNSLRGGIGAYGESAANYQNCIVFGITPYTTSTDTNNNGLGYTSYGANFTNVYTDAEVENVYPGGKQFSTTPYTFTNITKLSRAEIAKAALDWNTTFFLSENGPELRVFHDEIKMEKTFETHVLMCSGCGLKSVAGEQKHNFTLVGGEVKGDGTDVYTCTDCGYSCQHNSQKPSAYEPGDCLNPEGVFTRCNYCDWYIATDVGVALGHTLEWVAEKHATCRENGREGYWHCTVCGGNFEGTEEEALMAAMETSILDPDTDEKLLIEAGIHSALNNADGSIKIEIAGNDGHYWVCYTCDGKLLAVETKDKAEDGEVKQHKYEEAVCVECGWECLDHDFKSTGTVLVTGSCTEDRQEELKCTNCGYAVAELIPATHKVEKVAQVDPTANLEGTKAHYICTICKEIYSDAEGKNKVTTASLVIPKIVPNEYKNIVFGNGEVINVDTSNKSPSTGDSIVSVIALAALSGVAFVMTRKFKR